MISLGRVLACRTSPRAPARVCMISRGNSPSVWLLSAKSDRATQLTCQGICSYFVRMTRTIRTLGQAARHDFLLSVSCPSCQRETVFLASDIAAIYGEGRTIGSLRFTCTQCGDKGGSALPFHQDSSRKREIVVWRPVKVKAP